MRLNYPICLYPNDDGTYTVVVPDLDGCVTEGKDFSDALNMAVDAASGWVLDTIEDGGKPPKPSDPATIKADEHENGIVSVIMVDVDAYDEKLGNKPVTRTCMIPEWLKVACEAKHFDFSEIMKQALLKELDLLPD